jgi:hypothetical protein
LSTRTANPDGEDASVDGDQHPTTPDGRYFVVRGRLWRKANPALSTEQRRQLISKLMDARRALRGERPAEERAAARRAVDEAKQALGERGPVWWTDGAPDYNRRLATSTPYGEWYLSIEARRRPTA